MLGDFLYQLTGRDQANPTIELFNRTFAFPAGASVGLVLTNFYLVPFDHFLILQSVNWQAIPGAAQFARVGELEWLNSVNQASWAASAQYFNTPAVPAVINHANWSGSIIIPPNSNLSSILYFSAGGAVNVGFITLNGLLLPRGNVEV